MSTTKEIVILIIILISSIAMAVFMADKIHSYLLVHPLNATMIAELKHTIPLR